MPPDHLRWHLEYRQSGRVVAGDCYRLDQAATEAVTEETIRNGTYLKAISPRERRRLGGQGVSSMVVSVAALRHASAADGKQHRRVAKRL